MKKRVDYLKHLGLWIIGLGLVYVILSPYTSTIYLVKYDYVLQHLLFYKEFYRLLDHGLPFWSWNSFLGLNFWASKAYYLIGDPYAWLGHLVADPVNHVPEILTTLLNVKFLVAYSSFYLLTYQWNLKPLHSVILSLIYVFSGWNLVFLEHPMYTSFYSILPLLFFGIERFLKTKHGFWIYSSVALLVSINFYLFWVVSILVLIYWLFVWLYQNQNGWLAFFKQSFGLLLYYVFGVAIASVIWYPSVLHLLQSQRIGNALDSYTQWSDVNIASFFLFSLVPMLKYLDGVFKDYWYYFNQVGLYISVLAWFLVPQALWSSKTKREFFSILLLMGLSLGLMVSPQIGLFFHFTYSIRYTLIETFIGLVLMGMAFKRSSSWTWWSILLSEGLILTVYVLIKNVYVPTLYPELPFHLEELSLLETALKLSIGYTVVLLAWIFIQRTKLRKFTIIFNAALALIVVFELQGSTHAALLSQKNEWELPYTNTDFEKALNYIQAQDQGFYRIYTDFASYSNLSLAYGFMGHSTYDTTYEYSLSPFLHWTRQYPETNWEFTYSDPTLTSIVGIQYAIVRTVSNDIPMTDEWFAEEIGLDQDFGEFHVLRYKESTSFATSYTQFADDTEINQLDIESTDYRINELAGKLKKTLYVDASLLSSISTSQPSDPLNINPTVMQDNHLEFAFNTQQDSILLLRMPYDKGWSVLDQSESLKTTPVQGGFLGIVLPKGDHELQLNFSPEGFDFGKKISFISLLVAIVLDLMIVAYRTFKRLKPSSEKTSSEQRNASA